MTKRTITPDPTAWLRTINLMLDDPDFEFAHQHLEDVKEFVKDNNRITTGQTKAILKIRRSAQ